ncbi:S26 family signal peptidase [Natronolimnobius sp. AArcel1]|uniref:S26 family signal peptidase n=1 Tax=Natronolimnobius sp. AArcel1 TaxID=1679093 RepID=UPI0013EDAAC2|nr:S26 family signal peptidase [Natronolimnobius sp. AArcel1]NGM68708.1 S26 family signal peptidase [Natronolimnobius sp. AArcel1]
MSGPDAGRFDDDDDWEDRDDGADRQPPVETDQDGHGSEQPPAATDQSNDVTIADDGYVRWFLNTNDERVAITRDIVSSVAIVAVIGLLLFTVSGVWPPLVAVESGSMEPNMERGDLIFVVDDDRFVGDEPVDGTGVVPMETSEGHDKFGEDGDVIIFQPDGSEYQTPVIHRAHFWVDEGDDWVAQADEDIIGDTTCEQVNTCPAEHAGFITKGDANSGYDQHRGHVSDVVKPEWVTGKASFRIPWLGHVRLAFEDFFAGMAAPAPVIDVPASAVDVMDPQTLSVSALGATGVASVSTGLAVAAGRTRD